MLENALWAVDFISPTSGSFGSGVITFSGNKVFGGDSGFYYNGTYQINGNGQMAATVKITNYNPQMKSIFGGLAEFTLNLSGESQGDKAQISGTMIEQPRSSIRILMRKLKDI